MKKPTRQRKARKARGMQDVHLWIEGELHAIIKADATLKRRTLTAQINETLSKVYDPRFAE